MISDHTAVIETGLPPRNTLHPSFPHRRARYCLVVEVFFGFVSHLKAVMEFSLRTHSKALI
jgi:hypothetical protein